MKPDRTLYLEGRSCIRVMRDGPALRVRHPDRSDQLYPVRLLSAVVAGGNVRWETPALLACAEAGVIVNLVDGAGEPIAHLMPAERARGVIDHTDAVERFFARPEGRDSHLEWIKLRREEELRSLIGESPAQLHSNLAHIVCVKLFEAACKHISRRMVRQFDACLHGLLTTRVAAYLRAGGLDLGAPVLIAAHISLARDLSGVLCWDLLARRVTFLRLRLPGEDAGASKRKTALRLAAEFMEREHKHLEKRMETLRREWYAWMISELRGHGH